MDLHLMVILMNLGQTASASQQIFNPQCHPHVGLLPSTAGTLPPWSDLCFVSNTLTSCKGVEYQACLFSTQHSYLLFMESTQISTSRTTGGHGGPQNRMLTPGVMDSQHLWITWLDYSPKKGRVTEEVTARSFTWNRWKRGLWEPLHALSMIANISCTHIFQKKRQQIPFCRMTHLTSEQNVS